MARRFFGRPRGVERDEAADDFGRRQRRAPPVVAPAIGIGDGEIEIVVQLGNDEGARARTAAASCSGGSVPSRIAATKI